MKNWKRALLAATALTLAGMAGPALARTNHAVLVAVTAYPNLPKNVALVGPNHDAALVRDYLQHNAPVKFEPANLTLLADDVEGAAGSPTHEKIVATLKDVAVKAERGDFVYLHFSGHGAQQPAVDATTETDGLDEIFLPADTSRWVDQTKGVPNALMDDEIGGALDAIRNKGAFVWVIFDACHSGTATRGAPIGEEGEEQERKLDSKLLGIPDEAMAAAVASGSAKGETEASREAAFMLSDAPAGEDASRSMVLPSNEVPTAGESIAKAGMVAFFAAQTIETTPEMSLPKGTPDAPKFGLFTFTIFSKLAENPNVTYRQLGHAVLQQYSADSRTRPTPLFEGELDARVFGMEPVDTPMQWQVEIKDNAATVGAGLLHRLSPGTKLAILPSPLSELSETLGYLEVKSAKNLSSSVVPVAFGDKPALKLSDLPPNAYARLVEVAIDFHLKVARPSEAAGLGDEVALVNATLDKLAQATDKRFRIELVVPGAEADIRLAVLRENEIEGAAPDASAQPALWFLPASGELSLKTNQKPPLVAIYKDDPEKVAKGTSENLTKIFRATSLSRLAVASDYPEDQVSVKFLIRRQGSEDMEPLEAATVPVVMPGDEVHIVAENKSPRLVDINVLYVGSDYAITHIDAQRLVSGGKLEQGLVGFTESSFGMERMIAVLTDAPPMSEIENLKFLEQDGVPAATRSVGDKNSFSEMLTDIGLAPATRSVMRIGEKSAPKGAVMIFPLETVPRP